MCKHLTSLETELKKRGIQETSRGRAWSENCGEWVYYDCVLSLEKLIQRLNFPDFIKVHINDDNKSGIEAGFYCELCKDGVMGVHPLFGQGKVHID